MRELLRWLALVAALLLATYALGWWALPALGAVWGAGRGLQKDAITAGAAGIAAWGILLGYAWSRGPVGELAATLGAIVNVPSVMLVLMSLLFAALLAASAAGMAAAARRVLARG